MKRDQHWRGGAAIRHIDSQYQRLEGIYRGDRYWDWNTMSYKTNVARIDLGRRPTDSIQALDWTADFSDADRWAPEKRKRAKLFLADGRHTILGSVYFYLRSNPGAYPRDIRNALGIKSNTTHGCLKQLIRSDMLVVDRTNPRYPLYYPNDLAPEGVARE